MKIMLADGFLAEVRAKGDYLRQRLHGPGCPLSRPCDRGPGSGADPGTGADRGRWSKGGAIVSRMFARGCLVNFAGNVALRFLPPLIVSREEIDQMITSLAEVLAEIQGEMCRAELAESGKCFANQHLFFCMILSFPLGRVPLERQWKRFWMGAETEHRA